MDATYLDHNMAFDDQGILNHYSLEEGGPDETVVR